MHSSTAYNIFQTGVSLTAVFTGGMASTMKCFVIGTLVLTPTGRRVIESIKAGDYVISADSKTGETDAKVVVETYIRKERNLVHIFVGDDEIISTLDHPFYVVGKGFVNAGQLTIGTVLQNALGQFLKVNNIYKEICDEEVEVYNFQVADWHTYHVGDQDILVHNADYEIPLSRSKYPESCEHIEDAIKNGQPEELTFKIVLVD